MLWAYFSTLLLELFETIIKFISFFFNKVTYSITLFDATASFYESKVLSKSAKIYLIFNNVKKFTSISNKFLA